MHLRDEARHYFNETLGLTYRDLRKTDLIRLRELLAQTFENCGEEVNVGPLRLSSKFFQRYHPDRTVKSAFFFVDGGYFTERECISFNEDGFIGFCGWASDANTKPIVAAFKQWCDELKVKH